MRLINRFGSVFLRWDRLIALGAILLPIAATIVLGFLWLWENGWLLHFIGAGIVFGLVAYLARCVQHWLQIRSPKDADDPIEDFSVAPNSDWDDRQKAAFSAAKAVISKRTENAVLWPQMQKHALDVMEEVARHFGENGKKFDDFTMPEALLVVEQVAARYRRVLKARLPFADSISLQTLVWLWSQKDRAHTAIQAAQMAGRVIRFVNNPPVGVLKEIEAAFAGGNSRFLKAQAIAVFQAVLLEEVATVAVDLYSGNLRFSDAELLDIQLAATNVDRARLAAPDGPLRVVLSGQVSVGKSSLINALLGVDRAETDLPPTTDRLVTYEVAIDGVECLLVDMPGLDGSKASYENTLRELMEADIVVWVIHANRPARAPDQQMMSELRAAFTSTPDRRQPPIVPVTTFVDRLDQRWPFPVGGLPTDVRDRIAEAVTAIEREIVTSTPVPVSTTDPIWNVEAVRQAISGAIGEGLMVQRNRMRLYGQKQGSIGTEFLRGGRGLLYGTRVLGWRLIKRTVDPPSNQP